jgi:hypothetical protein
LDAFGEMVHQRGGHFAMKHSFLVAVAVAAALDSPATSHAQGVATGDRVRVEVWDAESPARREERSDVRGRLVRLTPDTVTIAMHGIVTPLAFDRDRINSLSVSRGMTSPSRIAWRRALPMAVAISLNFAIASLTSVSHERRIVGVVVPLIVFGPFVVRSQPPYERWEPIPAAPR